MSPEEQLRWEASWRPYAAVAAGLAGVLTLAGGIIGFSAGKSPGDDKTSQLLFFHEHAGIFVVAAVLGGLGAVAAGAALTFLFLAARARRPELPRLVTGMAALGGVLVACSQIGAALVLAGKANGFATSGHQTYFEAKAALNSGSLKAIQFLGFAGTLALGFAFVLTGLNAMRVGLLTKFMGILGIICGVLTVLPIGGPLPVVEVFWFGALAALFFGRWPNGVPPAWASGTAEPWPSQQELREQRDRARGDAGPRERRPQPAPAAAAAPPPAPVEAHPSSKKRKRKKRR